MDDLERILRAHPFFAEVDPLSPASSGLAPFGPAHIQFLVGCAKNVRFRAGEYLVREDDRMDALYLVRQGTVIIEMRRPGDPVGLETVGPGDVLGVSSILATAEHLDCRARDTVVALALDSQCLHRKMNEDPRLGYAIAMRLLERTHERLSRARLQHLDVYR
jgi:CRP-like cAMP-binding protein